MIVSWFAPNDNDIVWYYLLISDQMATPESDSKKESVIDEYLVVKHFLNENDLDDLLADFIDNELTVRLL